MSNKISHQNPIPVSFPFVFDISRCANDYLIEMFGHPVSFYSEKIKIYAKDDSVSTFSTLMVLFFTSHNIINALFGIRENVGQDTNKNLMVFIDRSCKNVYLIEMFFYSLSFHC